MVCTNRSWSMSISTGHCSEPIMAIEKQQPCYPPKDCIAIFEAKRLIFQDVLFESVAPLKTVVSLHVIE